MVVVKVSLVDLICRQPEFEQMYRVLPHVQLVDAETFKYMMCA